MEEKAIEILNILYDKGYESYIVGGYPRDKVLVIKQMILIFVLVLHLKNC